MTVAKKKPGARVTSAHPAGPPKAAITTAAVTPTNSPSPKAAAGAPVHAGEVLQLRNSLVLCKLQLESVRIANKLLLEELQALQRQPAGSRRDESVRERQTPADPDRIGDSSVTNESLRFLKTLLIQNQPPDLCIDLTRDGLCGNNWAAADGDARWTAPNGPSSIWLPPLRPGDYCIQVDVVGSVPEQAAIESVLVNGVPTHRALELAQSRGIWISSFHRSHLEHDALTLEIQPSIVAGAVGTLKIRSIILTLL